MAENERLAVAHNLQDSVVVFEGTRNYHRTAAWAGGDRYVVVLLNYCFALHDRYQGVYSVDARSLDLRAAQPPHAPPEQIRIDRGDDRYGQLRRAMADEINRATFVRKTGQAKYPNGGDILLFGEAVRPYTRKERTITKPTRQYPVLHSLIKQYIDHLTADWTEARGLPPASESYSTILLAKNSLCGWHRDKHNIGRSMITAFGDPGAEYEGGELLINPTPYPIYECYSCHCQVKGLAYCRAKQQHTDEDWLITAWRLMQAGHVLLGPGYRRGRGRLTHCAGAPRTREVGEALAEAATLAAVAHAAEQAG